MVKFPIEKIIIEGPDLAGKTTLFNKIHEISKFRWNIQDRSALSMLVYAKMYKRDTFHLIENFKKELFNLNNQIILLLPSIKVLSKRFQQRGDPIQNIITLGKLHKLFTEFEDEYGSLPNVTVIKKEIDDNSYKSIVGRYLAIEQYTSIHNFSDMCIYSASTQNNKEVVGLRFTYFDDGKFTDIKEDLLLYEGEKEYYDKVETQLRGKMLHNHTTNQDATSRRIIYHDDSCISLAHFLIRDQIFDAKFFFRSSNVKDTLNDIQTSSQNTQQEIQKRIKERQAKESLLSKDKNQANNVRENDDTQQS